MNVGMRILRKIPKASASQMNPAEVRHGALLLYAPNTAMTVAATRATCSVICRAPIPSSQSGCEAEVTTRIRIVRARLMMRPSAIPLYRLLKFGFCAPHLGQVHFLVFSEGSRTKT